MSEARRPGFTKERGYEEPLYFQTPRCLIRDGLIKELTVGSLKTLTVFYYLTFYYKTDKVKISLDVLMEHTGLSKKTQGSAIKSLAEAGHIFVERGSRITPTTYRMNIENGSDSYVALVEHQKPSKPQDVGGVVKTTPPPGSGKNYTTGGVKSTPPSGEGPKGVPKGSEEPTPPNPPQDQKKTGGGVVAFQIGNHLIQDWSVDPEGHYPLDYKRSCEKAIHEEGGILYPNRRTACIKFFGKYLENHIGDHSERAPGEHLKKCIRQRMQQLLASGYTGDFIEHCTKLFCESLPAIELEALCREVLGELEKEAHRQVAEGGGVQ